jgi:hypothetical protein
MISMSAAWLTAIVSCISYVSARRFRNGDALAFLWLSIITTEEGGTELCS